MKDFAKKTLVSSGLLRLAASIRGPSAAVLMYHSVLPDPSQWADTYGEIAHSEFVFRAQMELLAREFRPISLDEAIKHIHNGSNLPRRSVVVTFDDGYADNYDVAMPVLNRAGVPATFYVTVDCVENKRLPWPSRLRFAFRNTKLSTWSDPEGKNWPLNVPAEREVAFLSGCDACCQLSGAAQENFVVGVERELDAKIPCQQDSLMLTYEQMRALQRHGHIVGSHTMTHPNMAYIKADDAVRELTESKRHLEFNLETPIRHFSYPCPALSPHWSTKTAEQTQVAGYETAVTTDNGLTRSGDNPFCLKRLRPTKTVEGLRWNLESAFAGRAV
ncbi:MAG: polysaccharide deacetylase family protein [Candidatus Sulfotelmatobacter sp.]